jgi:hypothetical protein
MYWSAVGKVIIANTWRFLGTEDIQLQFPAALISGKLIPLPLWMAGYIKCTLKTFMIRAVHKILFFFYHGKTAPPVGHGLYIIEASRLHSDTPHSIGLVQTSDQPVAETCTWQHIALTRERFPCTGRPPFEPVIPASERPQTDALDRAATGIGSRNINRIIKKRKTRRAYVRVGVRCEYNVLMR